MRILKQGDIDSKYTNDKIFMINSINKKWLK